MLLVTRALSQTDTVNQEKPFFPCVELLTQGWIVIILFPKKDNFILIGGCLKSLSDYDVSSEKDEL